VGAKYAVALMNGSVALEAAMVVVSRRNYFLVAFLSQFLIGFK